MKPQPIQPITRLFPLIQTRRPTGNPTTKREFRNPANQSQPNPAAITSEPARDTSSPSPHYSSLFFWMRRRKISNCGSRHYSLSHGGIVNKVAHYVARKQRIVRWRFLREKAQISCTCNVFFFLIIFVKYI